MNIEHKPYAVLWARTEITQTIMSTWHTREQAQADIDSREQSLPSQRGRYAIGLVYVVPVDAVHALITEVEICALLRQTFSMPISHEGTSGPRLHELLKRIQSTIGPERYAEFVQGGWPERLRNQ